MRELGVWRSWLAHLVWDQRVLCSSHSTPTFKKRNLLIISRFSFYLYFCLIVTEVPSSPSEEALMIMSPAVVPPCTIT